jgi:hypothetical protein
MAKKKETPIAGVVGEDGSVITEPTLKDIDRQLRALEKKRKELAEASEQAQKAERAEITKAANEKHLAEAQDFLGRLIHGCFVTDTSFNGKYEKSIAVVRYMPGTKAVIGPNMGEEAVICRTVLQRIKIEAANSESFGKDVIISAKVQSNRFEYRHDDKKFPEEYIFGRSGRGDAKPVEFPNHIFEELWGRYTKPTEALAAFVVDGKTLPMIINLPDGTKTMIPQ